MDHRVQPRFIGINEEGLLRPCEISPVMTSSGYGYVWEWLALKRGTRSQHTFDMFFDCLEDARRHGYEPHFLNDQHTPDLSVVLVKAPA
ncbi:MAG: hypothetical protein V4637_06820 [Pseudomonadota bacterium]